MAANIEIKARVASLNKLESRVQALSDGPGEVIEQRDIFFCTARGRLKLRVVAPGAGYLIYYERVNSPGPSRSNYLISETADPDSLRQVLAVCLGVRGVVDKRRTLYWVGHTRIHLDQVQGLGSFMELEAVLEPEQTEEDGHRIVSELMHKLDIEEADLVEVAYIDLLERPACT